MNYSLLRQLDTGQERGTREKGAKTVRFSYSEMPCIHMNMPSGITLRSCSLCVCACLYAYTQTSLGETRVCQSRSSRRGSASARGRGGGLERLKETAGGGRGRDTYQEDNPDRGMGDSLKVDVVIEEGHTLRRRRNSDERQGQG